MTTLNEQDEDSETKRAAFAWSEHFDAYATNKLLTEQTKQFSFFLCNYDGAWTKTTDSDLMQFESLVPPAPKNAENLWMWTLIHHAYEPRRERVGPSSIYTKEQLAIKSSGPNYLSSILTQLLDVYENPECEEDEVLVPISEGVINKCREILVDASIDDGLHVGKTGIRTRQALPYGHVSQDGIGGVRVEWIRDNATVVLGVPRDTSKAFIYTYATRATSEMTPACASQLADRLRNIA